jgi:hypothetical protein
MTESLEVSTEAETEAEAQSESDAEAKSAAERARVMAAALGLGARLDAWSLALVLVAATGILVARPPLLSGVLLLVSLAIAGVQKVLALRVAFDESLFRYWAMVWSADAVPPPDPLADLGALDQALAGCGLRPSPKAGVVRDLASRLGGTVGLLRRQALALALQFGALGLGLAALRLGPG